MVDTVGRLCRLDSDGGQYSQLSVDYQRATLRPTAIGRFRRRDLIEGTSQVLFDEIQLEVSIVSRMHTIDE